MPEGPEVKRIGESLAKLISGKTIISGEILSGRYIKKNPSGWIEFQKQFPVKVVGAGAHGKFLYWLCDKEIYVYSTLGMTGIWVSEESPHSRAVFKFSDGSIVYYNDTRNFGTLKIVRGRYNMIDKLNSLGPDPLCNDLSDARFVAIFREKPLWGITKALMDQSLIAGIGNYIKADSLWLARISPHRAVADLSDGELAVLNRSIKQVMREAYLKGAYEDSNKFLVYGKTEDIDGNKIIKEQTADKRSTYWCPEVQK